MPGKKLAPRSFKVVYEPDGTGWHVRMPAVRGCLSWGRSLSEARRNIREALSTCEDILGADVDVIARDARFEETMKVSSSTQAAVRSYETSKIMFEKLQARIQEEQAKAARALVRVEGVSLRDAGEFLGLSRERVRKIASAPSKRPPTKKNTRAA